MNIKAALTKARKLWGKNAAVEYRAHLADKREERNIIATLYAGMPYPRSLFWATCKPYLVGVVEMGLFFAVKGEGESFEDAFEIAQRKGR